MLSHRFYDFPLSLYLRHLVSPRCVADPKRDLNIRRHTTTQNTVALSIQEPDRLVQLMLILSAQHIEHGSNWQRGTARLTQRYHCDLIRMMCAWLWRAGHRLTPDPTHAHTTPEAGAAATSKAASNQHISKMLTSSLFLCSCSRRSSCNAVCCQHQRGKVATSKSTKTKNGDLCTKKKQATGILDGNLWLGLFANFEACQCAKMPISTSWSLDNGLYYCQSG